MKRSGPLHRSSRLERHTRCRPVHPERAAAARASDFGPLGDFVRSLRCAVPGCRSDGPSDPAHVRSRGAGGHATHVPDLSTGEVRGNLAPLCRVHHQLSHAMPVSQFEAMTKVKMQMAADAAYAAFLEENAGAYPDGGP